MHNYNVMDRRLEIPGLWEKGKYEIYRQSFGETDTLVINTNARLEGARQNSIQFETELDRLKDIKKDIERELVLKLY